METRTVVALTFHLYPYQRAWIEDNSRFKIACKARQIGFTYAAAWRVVDKRLGKPGLTLWLSASERQALEAMEHVRRFVKELEAAALYEEAFIEGTSTRQHRVTFPNGSGIIALPSNPDTIRGFAGDIVLDEFAFHRDAEAIWRAAISWKLSRRPTAPAAATTNWPKPPASWTTPRLPLKRKNFAETILKKVFRIMPPVPVRGKLFIAMQATPSGGSPHPSQQPLW